MNFTGNPILKAFSEDGEAGLTEIYNLMEVTGSVDGTGNAVTDINFLSSDQSDNPAGRTTINFGTGSNAISSPNIQIKGLFNVDTTRGITLKGPGGGIELSGSNGNIQITSLIPQVTGKGDVGNSSRIYKNGYIENIYTTQIIASSNISSSGTVTGSTGSFSRLEGNSPITVGDQITFQQPITVDTDITASANISIPTNNASINMINGSILSRTGGTYPGIQLNTTATDNTIWFLSGDNNSIGNEVTASFVASGFLNHVGKVRAKNNSSLLLQGGPTPNDVNDGVKIETADDSNIYQPRFAIESDATTVDAYFTNINGLGINDNTPNAMLDVNGNINTTSHITASGNISASGNFIGEVTGIGGAVTGITSLLATDIKIGEDDETKIDFEDANEIHFYAANVHQVKLVDNAFTPAADSDVDLGGTSTFWKDAYIDSITTSGNVSGSILSTASFAKFVGDGSAITNLQRPITTVGTNPFTASLDNAGQYFRVGGNVTCSIKVAATASCEIGSEYEFIQTSSAGYLQFTTDPGVTLNSKGSKTKLAGQFSGATLKKIGTDEWDLIGDLG